MTSVKAPYVIKELASSAGGGSRRFTLDSQGFSYILELIQGREANVQRFGPRSQPSLCFYHQMEPALTYSAFGCQSCGYYVRGFP